MVKDSLGVLAMVLNLFSEKQDFFKSKNFSKS